MPGKEIPDGAISQVAKHISERNTKQYQIPPVGHPDNVETPQIFEIVPFHQIDTSDRHFFAVDGSYNSQDFYNGLSIGIYTAGYICYHRGVQQRLNDSDDPVILGKAYFPENILVANEDHITAISDELLTLRPVQELFAFWGAAPDRVFAYTKEAVCSTLPTVLSFCQAVLEWAMVLEIASLPIVGTGDFILKDGTLRPLQFRQEYLARLGRHLHQNGIVIAGVTKQSPIKMELSYTFKQVDIYLQDQLKHSYPFKETDPRRRKLCCWFEVPDAVLLSSYGPMYAKKATKGGRGFGLFHVARLDYVEKLQNYDWVVVDVNIFDAIPGVDEGDLARDSHLLRAIFTELTRLTQEHYILGYPYPLAEAHNFVTLRSAFRDEIINRVKFALYRDQRMDHVDIENLFLDVHDRF